MSHVNILYYLFIYYKKVIKFVKNNLLNENI